MGQVSISLNGRTFRLQCGEGEEERLRELASHIRKKIEALTSEFGQVGDDRLLLMAAILVTDELWDARDKITELVLAQSDKGAEKSADRPRARTKGGRIDPSLAEPAETPPAAGLGPQPTESKASAAS